MLIQIGLGSLVILLTIFVEAIFIGIAIFMLGRLGTRLREGRKALRQVVTLACVVSWLLLALSAAIWIWAGVLLALGQFADIETALYFSIVSFTTLGYGDVILGKEWRLLSGMMATNGLLLFSVTTAFLLELVSRLRSS